MTSRRAQSAGAIAVLMLIALGVLGIARGLSSDGPTVSGSILQTNGIHADWRCAWTNDDGDQTPCDFGSEPGPDDGLDPVSPGNPWGFDYYPELVDKDVGDCSAEVPEPDDSVDDQIATVTITNAYPSYECTFAVVVENTGTAPFTIDGFVYAVDPPLELLDDVCTLTQEQPGDPEIDLQELATIRCTIHVMQEAEQAIAYGFTISACSGTCEESVFQRAGLGRWRGAPAAISIRVASGASR